MAAEHHLTFGPFRLDLAQGRLWRGPGSALQVMLFLENLMRALLIFNGLQSRHSQ
jgi:hypothetical protein